MKCKKVNSLFSDYFDGGLDRETAVEVKAHLSLCRECSAEYDRFKKSLEILKRLKPLA